MKFIMKAGITLVLIGMLGLALPWDSTGVAMDKRPCTDESAMNTSGKWTHTFQPDLERSTTIMKEELPGLLKKMEVYADLIHQALGEPVGYNANWHRSIAGQLFRNGPAKYQVEVPLFRYYCQNGSLELNDEYGDFVSIQANGTWQMSGNEVYDIGGKHTYMFGSPIGTIRGFPAFETWPHGSTVSWVVLVARPGKSPFLFVTRGEFLDHLRAKNEKNRAEALAVADKINVIRTKAEQDKDKKKDLALFLKGAKDEAQRQHWIERFEKDYKTDERKRDEARNKVNKTYDKIRARIDAVAARYSPEQLRQTATASPNSLSPDADFDFKPAKQEVCGKGNCAGTHGLVFAVPDKDYFDQKVSNSAPRFFTVSFQWSSGLKKIDGKYVRVEPKYEKLRDDFFARFDFGRLASLLEK